MPRITRGWATDRNIFRLRVTIDRLIDLCDPELHQALSLEDAPACFLSKDAARAVAKYVRETTRQVQAIRVPSIAFPDDVKDHWNLVLFLKRLPVDPRRFITEVELVGSFQVIWL